MTTTSTRAQALAEQFEQVNAAAIAAVEAADDATWRRTCRDEDWPVGFAAWHIGDGHATIMGLVGAVASSQPLPPVTAAMLDARNAENLARHGGCSRQEALRMLRQHGTAAADAIRRLSDEQLERTATLDLFGGATMSVQQLIEQVVIGHAQHHLASMRAGA
jgi:hypothetical protein